MFLSLEFEILENVGDFGLLGSGGEGMVSGRGRSL